ncbi:MAG: hypothetical protein RI965_1540 [Bacteroidota bacterium]|jgi:hypothetical protein
MQRLNRILLRFLAITAIFNLCSLGESQVIAQKLSGQWIGSFTSKEDPSDAQTEYVLEIDVNGSNITGYSYTYFPIAGKRYFVICKLKGNYEAGSKSLTITETEKIKSNTPPDFQNCLQIHSLSYFKQGNKETLEGKWGPAEKGSNCGTGSSVFERKILEKIKPTETVKTIEQPKQPVKKPVTSAPTNSTASKQATVQKKPSVTQKTIQKKILPRNPIEQKAAPAVAEKNIDEKIISIEEPKKIRESFAPPKERISNRTYQILKTIEIEDEKITIDIYDNGQIDGDTVSIYLNDKLIVSKKRLTAKPINIQLNLDDDNDVYDIIMYAENLGSIPPNTALMIVQAKNKRYEINVTSTEQTSGAVRFKLKR